jgi:hypothetical protein
VSGRHCLRDHCCRISTGLRRVKHAGVPLCILGPGRLRLLPLGLGNAALDAEGGAVGAWDAQRGGVASYLLLVMSRPDEAAVPRLITHFPGVTGCDAWWLAFVLQTDRGAEARKLEHISHRPRWRSSLVPSGEHKTRRTWVALTFARSAGALSPEGRVSRGNGLRRRRRPAL